MPKLPAGDPSPEQSDPRQRLLAAAIACVEEHGVSSVTTRLIAARAGANSAAVNYYFGSKDQLMERALELTRREGFVNPLRDFDGLVEGGQSPAAALRSVLRQQVRDSIEYPRIAFAHLQPALENQRYDGLSVVELNRFLGELDRRLGRLATPKQRQVRRARLAQIWSTLGMNAMAPGLCREFTGLDLRKSRDLDLYVDQLLAGFRVE